MPLYFVIHEDSTLRKKYEQKRDIPIEVKDSVPSPSTGIQVEVVKIGDPIPSFVVIRIKALTQDQLPAIYTAEASTYPLPKVWQDGDRLVADRRYTLLKVGKAYSYGSLKRALTYIELAGLHLTRANAHLDEMETVPSWVKADMITFKDGSFLEERGLSENPL